MAAIVATVAYLGLEARAVEVQVQLIPGLPAFKIIELRDIRKTAPDYSYLASRLRVADCASTVARMSEMGRIVDIAKYLSAASDHEPKAGSN